MKTEKEADEKKTERKNKKGEKQNRKQGGDLCKKEKNKERKRNPHVHILYAIQESHNTAGQQL